MSIICSTNQTDSVSCHGFFPANPELPEEILHDTISQMTYLHLAKCCAVSRLWSSYFSNKIKEAFLTQLVFGKKKWLLYFGDVGEAPDLPPGIYEILKSTCPIWPDKRTYETHLLVLIPKRVNGQLLQMKTLGENIQNPKQGNPTKYRNVPHINEEQMEHIQQSYWVLFTKDVIPESRNKVTSEQKQLVSDLAERIQADYQLPKGLEAVTAIFTHYVEHGEYLYSNKPRTCTQCEEPLTAVGEFSINGLRVFSGNNEFPYAFIGAAAVRRL